MKHFLSGVAVSLLATSIAAGQAAAPSKSAQLQDTKPASTAASAVKIDPAKEADIRRLLELSGARALALQMMDEMGKSLKPMLTNSLPPGDYRDKLVDLFFAKFMAKADSDSLVNLAVPEYDKNFTHDEILRLIAFYQTPVGKKAVAVIPQLTATLQQKGRTWGESLGRESMMEVLTEHPELQQQIVDAQKAAQAKN